MKLDELVQAYIDLRNKKSQLKAQYEAKVAKYERTQDLIEASMLQKFEQMGVDSVKTPMGTAYAQTRASASVGDWDTFIGFVKEHDAYEMIERRVSKAAIEQYKAVHADLPPGVNFSETRVINFRKS
jgi:hypothetical protein